VQAVSPGSRWRAKQAMATDWAADPKGVNMTAQQQTTYQPDSQGLFTVSSSVEIPKQSPKKNTCVINNVILKETQEAHIRIAGLSR
ncbi:hypothetical protein chiPu_0022753, partial [Chiloscyllium punctatum]|nr:hypothetical protein [Chiloscyllium punctatum]